MSPVELPFWPVPSGLANGPAIWPDGPLSEPSSPGPTSATASTPAAATTPVAHIIGRLNLIGRRQGRWADCLVDCDISANNRRRAGSRSPGVAGGTASRYSFNTHISSMAHLFSQRNGHVAAAKASLDAGAGAVEPGPDRPYRNVEDLCHFLVVQLPPGDQQQDVAVPCGQIGQARFNAGPKASPSRRWQPGRRDPRPRGPVPGLGVAGVHAPPSGDAVRSRSSRCRTATDVRPAGSDRTSGGVGTRPQTSLRGDLRLLPGRAVAGDNDGCARRGGEDNFEGPRVGS